MASMREILQSLVQQAASGGISVEISVPERGEFGHFATSLAMKMARGLATDDSQPTTGKNPVKIAEELKAKIEETAPEGFFEKIEVAPPGFVNFWLTKEAMQKELAEIEKQGEKFGEWTLGKGKCVIVEYASLNIAKPLHVGYLRNIAIGDALANLHRALGYKVIRWNYLGDWGTQFGKLIAAYRLWGNKGAVEKNPIGEMLALYVKFHAEAKAHPELEDRGREEFRKLEEGDGENRKLWEWFKEESLKEFGRTLGKLGVEFDTDIGESFFENEMKSIVQELVASGIAVRSEGALIVSLDDAGLPPAVVEKSDGASLYLTRDLANLRYRVKHYKPEKILYVVGNEQSLHFEQVFRVGEKMGLQGDTKAVHVKYGLVSAGQGKKFSTREGNVVLLDDVIQQARERARRTVEEKNRDLSAEEKTAVEEAVAIGALKYVNLKENRNSNVVFDWEKMLDFSGDSAPYLQYTYARLRSILRKAGEQVSSVKYQVSGLDAEHELALIRKMAEFPHAVKTAAEALAPNALALYCYELANLANRFYETTPILSDEDSGRKAARLLLIETAARVLAKGLGMLGIKALEKI